MPARRFGPTVVSSTQQEGEPMSTHSTTASSRAGKEGKTGTRRAATRLWIVAALVVGSIALVLPVTASADALVSNPGTGQDCAFFLGGNVYRGSATEVITPNGRVNLSCHLSLES